MVKRGTVTGAAPELRLKVWRERANEETELDRVDRERGPTTAKDRSA